MIIDSSAIIAVIQDEPDARGFTRAMRDAPVRRLSAAAYVEVSAVVDGRRSPVFSAALDEFLRKLRVEIVPFTPRQAQLAREAYQRFGRGSGHPARLNMGDCFSYALAKDLGEPLLFKGNDFKLTDIEIGLEPIRKHRLSEVVAAYVAEAAEPRAG